MLSGAGSDSPNRRANAADGMHTRLTARLNELLAYKRWGQPICAGSPCCASSSHGKHVDRPPVPAKTRIRKN